MITTSFNILLLYVNFDKQIVSVYKKKMKYISLNFEDERPLFLALHN